MVGKSLDQEEHEAEIKHREFEDLYCLAQIREVTGDNGKRMQPELVEYIRATFESERRLRALLQIVHDRGHVYYGSALDADIQAALKIIPK